MSANHYSEKTFIAFKAIENEEYPKSALFEKAVGYEPFYYIKNNFDNLLNMGVMYLDNTWQKKIISWLEEFDDTYLIDIVHLDEKIERHTTMSGESYDNILHLAIMFGKIDMVKFLLNKAKTTMPKLLDYGYHANHSLLQMAILSQNEEVFNYILGSLEHDFHYKNDKQEGALGNAIFNYPKFLEKILHHYSNDEIETTIKQIQNIHDIMHKLYPGKITLKNNLEHSQLLIEKRKLEQSIVETNSSHKQHQKI